MIWTRTRADTSHASIGGGLRTMPIIWGLVVIAFGCGQDEPRRQPTAPSPTVMEYSLYGTVNDTAGRPIPDVRIEVLDGARAGVSAVTDASGHYDLPGPFSGAITIRAAKDGYVTVTRRYDPGTAGQRQQSLSVVLELSTPSVDLTGEYTLTLTAGGKCAAIPDKARSRTYTAVIAPERGVGGTNRYDGVLSGATFLATDRSDRFLVSVAGTVGRFYLGDPYDWTDAIVEELSPSTYVAIWGEGDLSVSDNPISGTLSRYGDFEYCASPTRPIRFVGINIYLCPVEPLRCGFGSLTLARR